MTVGTTVTIDPYADGYGWAQANAGDPAAMDLVTVVAHELGHVLGYGESSDPSSLMYEYLSPGQTRTITSAGQLSGVPAYSTGSDAPVFQQAAPIGFSIGGSAVTSLDVGSVEIGTTGMVTVTLTNTGSTQITGLTYSFASDAAPSSPTSPFSVAGPSSTAAPTSIPADSSVTLVLSYGNAPNVQETATDTLVIQGTIRGPTAPPTRRSRRT